MINMFDILGLGDPALSMHIVDSSVKKDTLKSAFISAIDQGFDPNDQEVKDYIYEQTGVYPYQLTDLDRVQLQNEISAYYYA